eukprot:9467574-Pyramimonas_sp.AAC.1
MWEILEAVSQLYIHCSDVGNEYPDNNDWRERRKQWIYSDDSSDTLYPVDTKDETKRAVL